MCAATAATQLAIMLAIAALIGVRYPDEPAGYVVGHVAAAVLLKVLISRSRRGAAESRR